MSDVTILGIAGLAATSATAIGQRVLENRRHAADLRHRRALADRVELREILDEAAQVLRRAMWGVPGVIAAVRSGNLAQVEAKGGEMQILIEEAALAQGRIALRLGYASEVTARYDEAVEVVVAMHRDLLDVLPRVWAGRMTFARPKSIAGKLEETFEPYEERFREARRAFIDAAEDVVSSSVKDP